MSSTIANVRSRIFNPKGTREPSSARNPITKAMSVASDTGYTFAALPLFPRLGLRAGIISGDEDPADPDLQTFNPLFPKGKYFDEIGLLGPYNLIDVHPILTFTISEEWELRAAAALYWRENSEDGLYA